MDSRIFQLRTAFIVTAVVAATAMMTSCASTRSSSPRQVSMSNPTVTYRYRNDDELIQANRRAITFCEPYQSLPEAKSFSNDVEGRKNVVFECIQTLQPAPIDNPASVLQSDYRTDQELLELSRNAQLYCMKTGKPEIDSSIVIHADGSRSVTFQCRPR